jgi:hypothetical protein
VSRIDPALLALEKTESRIVKRFEQDLHNAQPGDASGLQLRLIRYQVARQIFDDIRRELEGKN